MRLILILFLLFSTPLWSADKIFWFEYTTKRGDFLEELIQKIHSIEIARHMQKLKALVKKKNPHIRIWDPLYPDQKIKLIVVEKYAIASEVKKAAKMEKKEPPKDHYFDIFYQYSSYHFEETSPNQIEIDFVFPLGVGFDYYFRERTFASWEFYPILGLLHKSFSEVEGAQSSFNGDSFTTLKIPETLDIFVELKSKNPFWTYFYPHYFLKKSTLFGLDYVTQSAKNQVRKTRFFWAGLKITIPTILWGKDMVFGGLVAKSFIDQSSILDDEGNETSGGDLPSISVLKYGFFGEIHFKNNLFIGLGMNIYSMSSTKEITTTEQYSRFGLSF